MAVSKQCRGIQTVVIGAGYAGLPLGLALGEAGHCVTFYERDAERSEFLKRGESYIPDVASVRLRRGLDAGFLAVSRSAEVLRDAIVVIICVPTPLGGTGEPDLQCVHEALNDIAAQQHPGMLVILESTVYPGVTRELAVPRLTHGFELGKDVFVAYSPERLDPGNAEYSLVSTPKVVSGATPACLDRITTYYSAVFKQLVAVSSTDAAEMVKLLENTFRAVNVGLVNELAIAARRLGLDPFEVTRAAATKPFGFMPFSPGPGLGGHCIPVDPLYLNWKLASLQQEAMFITVADSVNAAMPRYVVERLGFLLKAQGQEVEGSKILVYGMAYKANVADTRESPARVIFGHLHQLGAEVSYLDPWVKEVGIDDVIHRGESPDVDFGKFDAVVIVTDHDVLPKERLCRQARLVLDTRDALREVRASFPHVHVL